MPETIVDHRHYEGPDVHSKVEREEGELSPTGDCGEDNFAVCRDAGAESEHKEISATVSRPFENGQGKEGCHGEATTANGADADEEGCHRLSEDSENGDASVSESVEGEDRSPEEQEEDGEHENKAESEGEADSMTDAHDVADGALLPFSDHFPQTVRPLAKHLTTTVDGKIKDSRVFYGSDSFYVLFRLHQVSHTFFGACLCWTFMLLLFKSFRSSS